MDEKEKNKQKLLKYVGYFLTLLLIPIIVTTIGHFIEYNYFQDSQQKNESIDSSQLHDDREITPSKPAKKDTVVILLENKSETELVEEDNQISRQFKDTREVKLLPQKYIGKDYNWATRLAGWFFVILPIFLSLGLLVGEDGRGCVIGCLWGIWVFVAMWIILTLIMLVPYIPLIKYLGTNNEFEPLIYTVEIYENWINQILKKL
jgi:hypothetical protein